MTKSFAAELNIEAQSLMKKRQWKRAIKLFTGNMTVVKNNWKLTWNLGWCHFKPKNLALAQHCFKSAIKLSPDNSLCYWALGIVLRETEQYEKAEKYLRKSLRLKDGYLNRIGLALAYLAQGKVKKAEKIHIDGIALNPDDHRRYESYAAFLYDVEREDEAKEISQKAKRIGRSENKRSHQKSQTAK